MSQKLPVNNFEWIEDTSQFNEDLQNYNEESDEVSFLEVAVQYLEKLHELHNNLPFLPQIIKIGKVKQLVAKLHWICYTHKKSKKGIKWWLNFGKHL